MGDVFSPEKRSAVMRAIRSNGNRDTEVKLAAIFRTGKIRGWRRNYPQLGKPDFCFPKLKVAVFVDGCFWHGCPQHGRRPTSNVNYWHAKLDRNKVRDLAVVRLLKKKGWLAIRIWEHELSGRDKILQRLKRLIESRVPPKKA